jgi:hypothetical protein
MTNKKNKKGGKETKATAKSKQQDSKATTAGPADNFDDMLAEFVASDLLTSSKPATTSPSSSSTSSSSFSSSYHPLPLHHLRASRQ